MDRQTSNVPFTVESPYLSVYVPPQQSEFIFVDGARDRPTRGRFELAFSQIGSSVMIGATIGGTFGTYKSRDVFRSQQSFQVKRSQMLNYVTRNGATMANRLGTIALLYSAIGVGNSFIMKNDDLNTLTAATGTGLLYGALSGGAGPKLRRTMIGSAIGLTCACIFIFVSQRKSPFK